MLWFLVLQFNWFQKKIWSKYHWSALSLELHLGIHEQKYFRQHSWRTNKKFTNSIEWRKINKNICNFSKFYKIQKDNIKSGFANGSKEWKSSVKFHKTMCEQLLNRSLKWKSYKLCKLTVASWQKSQPKSQSAI